ncbi:protocadherin-like wing polarity protein stan [Thrips palmi]|uniref:Protocadherin-like wing polarity protein stan n=1 Tax=Thrips palmi TaxID=161013 RepID=A0A6P8Y6R8_THRPL|nr:protocadherin-like wing polarity protein stan [Thrips palmi]
MRLRRGVGRGWLVLACCFAFGLPGPALSEPSPAPSPSPEADAEPAPARHAAVARAQADSRCFLESGSSAESFFVSEDLPVGSVIGVLSVLGDPSEPQGDISLRLQETDSPVRVSPGSKNLTLMRRLDKEGVEGPSSVYISIICDRKRTADPGISIPVNIRVTDANDNAPQFVNAPYVLNISEVTVVGTRVLQGVRAVDVDQPGPYSTVQYSVLPGPNADYFMFVNALEGTLALRKPLDYETLSNFTVNLRAQDQGTPPQFSDTTLYVQVVDADDQNPRFYDERYSAILPDRAAQGTRLRVQPREIAAYDQDVGINSAVVYSFNSAGGSDYRYFDIDPTSGHLTVKRSIPDDDMLQPATLVVRASQHDNPDRYALATLTVSRPGTSLRDLQFLQSAYYAGVLENVPLHSVLITAVTNKPRDKRLRFWLEQREVSGRFGVTGHGDIILLQALDYETEDLYLFHVHATDGRMQNTTALVNISVLNVNDWDPRFRFPQYEFFVPELAAGPTVPNTNPLGLVVGRVEVADGDRGDTISLELRGPGAKMFEITPNGEIVLLDPSLANTSTVHLVAVATDTGIPPRQASAPVIVHLPEALVRSSVFATGSTGVLVMAVFGAVLGVLGIVIVALVFYIYKNKRPKSTGTPPGSGRASSNKMGGLMTPNIQHEKLPPASDDGTDHDNNSDTHAPSCTNNLHTETSTFSDGKTPRYTATVKRSFAGIMARNAAGRASQRRPPGHHHHHHHGHQCSNPLSQAKRKVAPAPPQVPGSVSKASNVDAVSSGVSWPLGSIPRRVKKLSWDDDDDNKPELDPEVSVTPLGGQNQDGNTDHMNLTVYF